MAQPAASAVGLTAAFAKTAHENLLELKDGPDKVKTAKADVEGLRLVLERQKNCPLLEEHGWEAFRALIKTCCDDVECFADKLQSLAPVALSSRRAKYWKMSMALWEENALWKMSTRLSSHTNSLSLHLNLRYVLAIVEWVCEGG
ncbi:hypothetical protein L209DRAFT_755916 [Thermothelomyces heterothallicus CBS 203.75]